MADVQTADVQYVFLDIVRFTQGRSVEAQSDIVHALNDVVEAELQDRGIGKESLILLPTGDGMCIALLGHGSFDSHLRIALGVTARLEEYNQQLGDSMRKFQVRIGVNQNIDNIVQDINGRRNVAGVGINMAQRIMSLADGGQVLVGQAVFEVLRGREKYMKAFRRHDGRDKHGNAFPAYQYVLESNGLDTSVPSSFRPATAPKARLTMLVAYYFAHALTGREFFLGKRSAGASDYVFVVLLYFLARDSEACAIAPAYDPPANKMTYGAGKASLGEQYDYYYRQDFEVLYRLFESIVREHLFMYSECFEDGTYNKLWMIVNDKGRERLKEEYPEIWESIEKSGAI